MTLRLLCITAHPDDESGDFGGALLMAHLRGVETSVLCLTEGRAASHRGDARTDDELAAARLAEMDVSCRLLGVTRHEVWQYPDSRLIEADLFAITTRLVGRMRELRPHVVLTFGGDGGPNLHRDHAVASFAASAAFHWSGRSNFAAQQLASGLALWAPQKLYNSANRLTVTRFVEEAAVAPRTAASLTLSISAEVLAVKRAALEAHTSQGVLDRAGPELTKHGHEERYLLVSARNPDRFVGETDMLSGLDDDL